MMICSDEDDDDGGCQDIGLRCAQKYTPQLSSQLIRLIGSPCG